MSQTAYRLFDTALGPCAIAWAAANGSHSAPAVTGFQLPEADAKQTELRIAQRSGIAKPSTPPRQIAAVIKRVCAHLDGQAQDFRDVPVDVNGAGAFARQVYDAAREIPPGQTRSYGQIAMALGQPGAARAVGQALGRNPIALIIPCHRVLAANGKPGGFSAHGGWTTKSRLLALEGVTLGPPATIQSDHELRRVAALLAKSDPRLSPCVAQPMRMKLRREQSPYEALFRAIVHQQLSPRAASTILERVKSLYSQTRIPTPAELLDTPDDKLREAGLSRPKIASLKDLAAKVLDGTVPSARQIARLTDEQILDRLTSIRGVGRWTVQMLLIFNLGRMDVFPVDDYALRRSIANVFGMKQVPSARKIESLGDPWRPHRTVASLYLWNALNGQNA